MRFPKHLQSILWSRDIHTLDFTKDCNYIIHQVLMFGSLRDIRWLVKRYSLRTVQEEFTKRPQKIYTKEAFNFIKKFILNITEENLDDAQYVKHSPRGIGRKPVSRA